MDPKPVELSQITLSQVMGITDANLHGNVHGGVIMRLVDTAGGTAASRHAQGPVVTAVVDEISFLHPVFLGDLLIVKASVNDTGRTSMEVGVRVEVERGRTGERVHTSSAYLVFVALDEDNRPREVPGLQVQNPDQIRRQKAAKLRRLARQRRREEIEREAPREA